MNRETFKFTIWNISRQEECQLLSSKRSLYFLVWSVTDGDISNGYILEKQIPMASDVQVGYSHLNNAILMANTIRYQHLEDRQVNSATINGGERLAFWKTGLFYNANKEYFIIKSLPSSIKDKDKNDVLIMCSQTTTGRKILCD